MFFTARSSLSVSEWKEYFSYFWRQRKIDCWTPTSTRLSVLLCLSVRLFPHFLILTMCFPSCYLWLRMNMNIVISVWVNVRVCAPPHLSPSCRHTTSASLSSHWSSHIEPHCPAWKTSIVPSDFDRPPTSRMGSAIIAEMHTFTCSPL